VARAQQQAQQSAAAGTPTNSPDIPFVDPGAAKRQAAQQQLQSACDQLKSAGDTAAAAVGRARDQAPPKPGFWSRLGSDISGFASDVGHDLESAGVDVVNALASTGNAVSNHPGDVLSMLGGVGLTAISSAGDAGGAVLDATGLGAIAGAPLNALSTAGIVAGAGITAGAASDLFHHGATDDRVSPLRMDSSSEPGARATTKTDRIKEHLTDRDLDAAGSWTGKSSPRGPTAHRGIMSTRSRVPSADWSTGSARSNDNSVIRGSPTPTEPR
jgi:hypothetical protein